MKKWLLALAFAFFATPAFAEDFTITVPVEFSALPPNVDRLFVSCQVIEENLSRVTVAAGRELPITGGAYRGDVVFAVNANAGRDPSLAVQYRCVAWLIGRTPSNPNQRYFGGASESLLERFPLAPGAPVVLDTGLVRFR